MPRLRVQVPGGNVKSIVVPSSQTGGTDPPNGPASATGNVPITAGQTLIIQQIAKTSALSAGAIATGMLLNANNTWNGANIFAPASGAFGIKVISDFSSSSYGLYIQAGSGSGDEGLTVYDYSGSDNFFKVRGDGVVQAFYGMTVSGTSSAGGLYTTSLSVQGTAGNYAAVIAAGDTTGEAFGLLISAGTNSSDYPLNIESASGESNIFTVRGDGKTTISPAAGFGIEVVGPSGGYAGISLTAYGSTYDSTDFEIFQDAAGAYLASELSGGVMDHYVAAGMALGISAAGLVSLPQLSASTGTTLIESGDAIYSLTSSRDYKVDIEDANEAALTNVLKLRPVWYRSNPKTTSDRPDWGWYGLIAEEVAEIDPRLVNYWDQGRGCERVDRKGKNTGRPVQMKPKSVGYERIAPLLIPHINRLYKKIAALEAKLSAMSTTA